MSDLIAPPTPDDPDPDPVPWWWEAGGEPKGPFHETSLMVAAIRRFPDGDIRGGKFYPLMVECPQFVSHLVTDQMRNAEPSMELPEPPICKQCNDTRQIPNPDIPLDLDHHTHTHLWQTTYRDTTGNYGRGVDQEEE